MSPKSGRRDRAWRCFPSAQHFGSSFQRSPFQYIPWSDFCLIGLYSPSSKDTYFWDPLWIQYHAFAPFSPMNSITISPNPREIPCPYQTRKYLQFQAELKCGYMVYPDVVAYHKVCSRPHVGFSPVLQDWWAKYRVGSNRVCIDNSNSRKSLIERKVRVENVYSLVLGYSPLANHHIYCQIFISQAQGKLVEGRNSSSDWNRRGLPQLWWDARTQSI